MSIYRKDIRYIKGIGEKKQSLLNKLNIFNVIDILEFFPRGYEDRSKSKKFNEITDGEKALVKAKLVGVPQNIFLKSKRKKGLRVSINDGDTMGYATFFNTYASKSLQPGVDYLFYGKCNNFSGRINMNHPEFSEMGKENLYFNNILPVYPLTKGVSQKDIIKVTHRLLVDDKIDHVDYLSEELKSKYKLCGIDYAYKNIHFPSSARAYNVAKYRLIFEELYFMQLGLFLLKKKFITKSEGLVLEIKPEVESLIASLPFELTIDQNKVLKEIISDLTKGYSMNRLVQGDVGSGKTIVAIISAYMTFLNGYQSAIMAPTEILAEQHYESFSELLEPLGVRIKLLTRTTKKKKDVLKELEEGQIDIVIGTHALLQEKVVFKNLGLAVTDEQHRFGVRQRTVLKNKGENTHVMVMSATPIPRTLSLILYGDLDISVIETMPPGRKDIKTYVVKEDKKLDMYGFIKEEVDKGRQAYIVCPLVEESEKIEAQAATELFEDLTTTHFKGYKIALIHGKLKASEKDAIMKDYNDKKYDILISTTVIEVGINVPNSTIMAIINSERFGLAQLHQLRGRVGRGQYQSYCFLLTQGKSKMSKDRMAIMAETNNGFVIAEKDLELRGPGDFFGTKQHGIPELKIADLSKHRDILKDAQNEAIETLSNIKNLDEISLGRLKEKIEIKFSDLIHNITI